MSSASPAAPSKKKKKNQCPELPPSSPFVNIDTLVCGEKRRGVQKDSLATLKSFICIRLVSEPYRSDCDLPERLPLCLIVWLPEGWSDYVLVQHGKVMGALQCAVCAQNNYVAVLWVGCEMWEGRGVHIIVRVP